jgi:hypothetical protein
VSAAAEEIDVDGVTVRITNRDKVFFPELGAAGTKGALIDYYRTIAETMLTTLRDRPTHLQRFPDGIDGQSIEPLMAMWDADLDRGLGDLPYPLDFSRVASSSHRSSRPSKR